MVRFIIILGLGVIGITVALAFYHPPMRLMPAPEVFLDGEVNAFSADPALAEDPRISLFYATNRLPVGPHSNRLYTVVPGRDLHMGVATIRIGEEGTTWDRIYAWSTGAGDDRRPFLNLENLNEQASFEAGNRSRPKRGHGSPPSTPF